MSDDEAEVLGQEAVLVEGAVLDTEAVLSDPATRALGGDDERTRRWRLVLGAASELPEPAGTVDLGRDRALSELYDGDRRGSLGRSQPRVASWLGDIREYFPTSVVQVLQSDALERLGLRSMLTEPELLSKVEPDVRLVGTLLTLKDALPDEARDTARMVVAEVVRQVEERIGGALVSAVSGALNKARRTRRPRPADVDWPATIRSNLRNYRPEVSTVVLDHLLGGSRSRVVGSFKDVVLCVDQSGSMAASVVYAGVLGAALASVRSVSTSMVVFDTEVVDLTELLDDPVEVLFGTQLGGGTDINRALSYCQQLVTRPTDTTLVLISDLYEGGGREPLLERVAELLGAGVQVAVLLALSDEGAPISDKVTAQAIRDLGAPVFACTPDVFPDLLASALSGEDLGRWGRGALRRGALRAGGGQGWPVAARDGAVTPRARVAQGAHGPDPERGAAAHRADGGGDG